MEGILLETWDEECDEKLWEGGLRGKQQLDCEVIKVNYKIKEIKDYKPKKLNSWVL